MHVLRESFVDQERCALIWTHSPRLRPRTERLEHDASVAVLFSPCFGQK